MKKFNIPGYYKSSFIGAVKELRKVRDPRKKDFHPTILDFGPVAFHIARHFGFCYGVENAIEISYRTIEENRGKRVFLLSQMIHNPVVNEDLESKGLKFLMDTEGNQLIDFDEVTSDDVVIIPAFGTTVEIEQMLQKKGIQTEQYDTTCPFVEKVWTASAKLGRKDSSIVVHGKPTHEETRATFSHSKESAPTVVVKNMEETEELCRVIQQELSRDDFFRIFDGRFSDGFDPDKDLIRLGVVNQTTMLASETHAIAQRIRQALVDRYGEDSIDEHYTDTRDTLCYATNDNQQATYGLLKQPADLALVVGGYNSSNTSHLVELCEEKLPTYFIKGAEEILDRANIHHFMWREGEMKSSGNFLPEKDKVRIILTSGASCPDTQVDTVMDKLLSYFNDTKSKEEVLEALEAS